MSEVRSLDFEIIKEPWNKYQIIDNSVLKVRTILTRVERRMKDNKPYFKTKDQSLIVINADPSLKGEPDTKDHSAEEIKRAVEKKDMRYDTISQDFNEYILDDGTKIKIYTNVTNIDRSRLFNGNGDPIYNVSSTNQIEIRPSSRYGSPDQDEKSGAGKSQIHRW